MSNEPARAPRTFAFPALLLGAVAVGCAPILVRLSEVGPSAAAFWRVSLALVPVGLFVLMVSGAKGGSAVPRTARERLTAAIPGVFLGAELVVWHISLHMTSVANATLLVNLTPIFAALFGWALFRRPVGRVFMSGAALALAGVALLTFGGAKGGEGSLAGDAVALAAAMIYAGYFMTLGAARSRFSASSVMFASTATAAVVTLPLALVEGALAPVSLAGWVALAGLAWVVQAGGQGLVTFAMAWLSATVTSLTMLIQPVVAAGLAWALLGEQPGALQAVGGAIVLLGVLIARRG